MRTLQRIYNRYIDKYTKYTDTICIHYMSNVNIKNLKVLCINVQINNPIIYHKIRTKKGYIRIRVKIVYIHHVFIHIIYLYTIYIYIENRNILWTNMYINKQRKYLP